jgi:hypothetical protein|tara:strand:- start:1309 stop:2148 length:840 start_codon:yes stop_codon:yes gene_type:complete
MTRSIILFISISVSLHSQEDLLGLIDDNPKTIPVMATFKATRIVNAQSIEMPKPRILEFVILHRFGSMANGAYDLFGMDEAVIRFDLEYGFSDRLSIGIGRSSLNKTYDIFSKLKIVDQRTGHRSFPISLVLFTKMEIETIMKDMDMQDRYTYDVQFLLAKKLNRSLSLQLMPTFIHRNLVETHNDHHDLISLGIGGRIKMTRRTSINFDTFFPIGKRGETYKQGWGIGYDIETGGHVFQLMVTNARGSFESEYIENASGAFEDLNLYLGFNISRAFYL